MNVHTLPPDATPQQRATAVVIELLDKAQEYERQQRQRPVQPEVRSELA